MPIVPGPNKESWIVLDDFRGGINSLIHPLLINDNQTPTATNVWATGAALTKRPARTFYPLVCSAFNSISYLLGNITTGLNSGNFGAVTSSGIGGTVSLDTINVSGNESLVAFLRTSAKIVSSRTGSLIEPMQWTKNPHLFTVGTIFRQTDWYSTSGAGCLTWQPGTSSAFLAFTYLGSGYSVVSAADGEFNPNIWALKAAIILTATVSDAAVSCTGQLTAMPYKGNGQAGNVLFVDHSLWALNSATASHGGTETHIVNFTPGSTAYTTQLSLASAQDYAWPPHVATLNYTQFVPFTMAENNASGAVSFSYNNAVGDVSVSLVDQWPYTLGQPVVHQNYMFAIAGNQRTRILWSAIGDATTWPANNFQDVDKDGGLPILKLVSFEGNLIIFKKDSMWLLSGNVFDPSNPTYNLYKLSVPPDFIIEYPEAIIIQNLSERAPDAFTYLSGGKSAIKILTRTGLFTYLGGMEIIKFPEDKQIEPTLLYTKKIGKNLDWSGVYYGGSEVSGDYCAATVYNSNLILGMCVSAIGRTRRQLVKDYRGAWWAWDSVNSPTELNPSVGTIFNGGLYFGESIQYHNAQSYNIIDTAMGVIQAFVNSNNDTLNLMSSSLAASSLAISADWKSKIFDIGYGQFYNVTIFNSKQSTGNLNITWWIDGANSASAIFDMTVGSAAAGGLQKNTVTINQVGHSIQFKIWNNNINENFEIFKLVCRTKQILDEEIV